VAAGNIGSEKLIQYGTIGDTNNVASRICSVAKADEILVSHSTYLGLQDQMLPFQQLDQSKLRARMNRFRFINCCGMKWI
jgi:adenylate cyclase